MLGLAALAALLAMAFVGASSAMAEPTVLCSNDIEIGECEEVTHVHETSVGKAKLESELPTIECNVLFLGSGTGGTSPLVISGNFTYSSCNNFCSVKEENGPAEIKVLSTGKELSSVTGEGLVRVQCPFINCSYNGEGLEGHGLGALTSTSANGNVVITGQETNKETGGEICPPEAFLNITTTPLVATYPRRVYCVEYEHQHGFYETDGCGNPRATRAYRFMLVVGPNGRNAHEHLCAKLVPLPHTGLYKNSTCTEDDKTNTSLYELAEILLG